MNKKRILLVLIFFAQYFFSQKIMWKQNTKLTWEDFKSKNNLGKDSTVVAFTSCGMGYSAETTADPNAPVKIEVSVFFNPQKSWKIDHSITDRVLLHEQKHFDIAEIFGRKLRRKIAENIKNFKDYQQKFSILYKNNLAEYKKFQQKYDDETNHSLNKEKQDFYNTLITQELKKLNNYRSIEVSE